MADIPNPLHCDRHVPAKAAFVCRHLLRGTRLGFFHADNGPYPDAWCAECDALMMQTGRWTAKAEKFAGISVVCHHYYINIHRRNRPRRES